MFYKNLKYPEGFKLEETYIANSGNNNMVKNWEKTNILLWEITEMPVQILEFGVR